MAREAGVFCRTTRRDPPADPPEGAERLMWCLADQVAMDHVPRRAWLVPCPVLPGAARVVPDGARRCRGCRRVSGRVVAWPCTFVRLGELAQKIVEGELGER